MGDLAAPRAGRDAVPGGLTLTRPVPGDAHHPPIGPHVFSCDDFIPSLLSFYY